MGAHLLEHAHIPGQLTLDDLAPTPAPTVTPRLLVIACGARKGPQAAPAADLYRGQLFTAARRAAEADGRPWVILSAKHGLLRPTDVIDPYDATLTTDDDVTLLGSKVHSAACFDSYHRQMPGQPEHWRWPVHLLAAEVEAWCPARYVQALRLGRLNVTATPLAGLGIGQQKGWLTARHHQQT